MTIQQYEHSTELALSTTQDVAVHRLGEWATSADAAYRVAERLAQSAFVPVQFRGKPVELTAAILSGLEVGLSPMSAMRAFDVIQGQAAARAVTLRAIVQSHGHEMVLVESTVTRCRMKGKRRGSQEWQHVSWTLDRARDLGLTGKDNWKKQPAAMLIARATSELARLVASDAILGIAHSAEEIADGGAYDEQVSADTTDALPSNGTRRMGRNLPPAEDTDSPGPASGVEPEGGEDASLSDSPPEPDGITSGQLKKIGAAMRDANITERADALAYVADVIGRPITSRNDLTKHEASLVIDELEREARGETLPDPGAGADPWKAAE